MSQPRPQLPPGVAGMNGSHPPFVHLQQWQGSARPQQSHQQQRGLAPPGIAPPVPARGLPPPMHPRLPYFQPPNGHITTPSPSPVQGISPYSSIGASPSTPALAGDPTMQMSRVGAPTVQSMVTYPITQSVTSPPQIFPLHPELTTVGMREGATRGIEIDVFSLPPEIPAHAAPEPALQAPGWPQSQADTADSAASPRWFSTEADEEAFEPISARSPPASAPPSHIPGLQTRDAAEELFHDVDTAGTGVVGLEELCTAIARFVGKREVSEAEVLRVTARLNHEREGAARVTVHALDVDMLRHVLRAIRPTDFAGREVMKGWLQSTGVLDAFADELDAFIAGQGAAPGDALEVLSACSESNVKALCHLFHQRLDPIISKAIRHLKGRAGSEALSAEKANHKFAMMDDANIGNFADVGMFFKGLDGYIGLPSPRVLDMMKLEHMGAQDSRDKFVTTNYGGTETYPALEWEFVNSPDASKVYPGKHRATVPLSVYLSHETAIEAELEEPEIIALRLFTGPMFMKYNAKLRNFPEDEVKGLKGNGYVNTIHAVVSGVLKLSRIWKPPPDRKVYRGLGGMVLPERFWKADKFGCRGGVEFALMSTTIKREVAIQYSGEEKQRPTIFEIEVGQVDRGASLSWVSQYPVEEEVVMPPLSNLEVVGDARMEASSQGLVMVIPLRINVNLKSLTIDELMDRRKQLHLSMVGNLYQEAQRDLTEVLTQAPSTSTALLTRPQSGSGLNDASSVTSVPSLPDQGVDESVQAKVDAMLSDFSVLTEEIRTTGASWFNDDTNFKNAMSAALDMKRGTLRKFVELLTPRFQRMSEEVRFRIQASNCSDWARDGTVYRIISDTTHFPWEAVAEGKVKEVELLASLSEEQAAVAWEALAVNCAASQKQEGPPAVESVQIRGLDGKVGKVELKKAIAGDSLAMMTERIGIDGVRIPQVQGMGQDGVRLLLPLFSMNLELKRIDLSGSLMGADVAHKLAAVLKTKPALQVIKIRGIILVHDARTKSVVDMSARKPFRPPSVRRPQAEDATRPRDGGSSAKVLARAARSKRVQRRMSLGSFGLDASRDEAWEPIDVEGGIVLAAFISDNRALTELNLSGNRIGPEGATALAEVLDGRRLPLLQHLDVRDNNICAPGATALSSALLRHTALTCLDVRDNRTGASGPKKWAPAISANRHLVKLNAVEIDPDSADASPIAPRGWARGSAWKVRSVSEPAYEMVLVANRIALRAQAPAAPALASLDLADCQLGAEGARLLSHALLRCSGLKELVLRGNALRAAGAVEVAPALRACEALVLLDLSNNLISCEGGGTEAIADALRGHPNLKRLVYSGNISEGFLEFQVCFPRFRDPYRQIAAAVPRAQLKFFPRSRLRYAMLSWVILLLSLLSLVTGLVGAPIAFAERQYIFGWGITGIGVMGLLGVGWWVRWTGVRWSIGFLDCFVTIVQLQEQDAPPLPSERDALTSSASSTHSPRHRGDTHSDDLRFPTTNNHSHAHARTHDVDLELQAPAGSQPRRFSQEAHGRRAASLEHARASSAEHEVEESQAAQVEEDLALVLNQRLAQQVPMLLEQYVQTTTHPASLDQQLVEHDEDLKRHWTIGTFFHSSTPLELALRRNVVKWLLAVFVLYFGTIFGFFLWPYIYAPDFTFRTFRVVIDENQAREIAPAASVSEFNVAGVYCAPTAGETDPNLIFSRNTVIREYEYPVTVGRWKMVSSKTNPPRLDPFKFELQGCTERYHHCIHWTSITGMRIDPRFPQARGADVWYSMVEPWQQTIVRFVPMVFAFGFLALLYCSLSNRQRYGRVVLAATFSIGALLYIISTHPMLVTQDRMRWVSGGCLGFMPLMLALNERYVIHGVVLYGLIYCPMVGVLFTRIYEPESLPQMSKSVGIRNYDQLTVMPILALANCFVLPMIARYCWYRAKTKVAILKDIRDYIATWEELQKSEPDALRDLKSEIDKVNAAIDKANAALSNASHGSASFEQAQRSSLSAVVVPRHRVTLLDLEEGEGGEISKLARAGSASRARASSSLRLDAAGTAPNASSARRRASVSKARGAGHEGISSLWQVYAQATGLEKALQRKVQAWALLTGGGFFDRRGRVVRWEEACRDARVQRRVRFEKLKDARRAIDKVLRFYDKDVSRLLDVCRQQVVFERVEDMSHCLAVIRQDAEVQVVRVKNRMDTETDQHKVYGGYRDVALNLRFRTEEAEMLGIDGHICEVRLVHIDFANMLQGPEGKARHKRYVQYRTARGW